MKLFKINGISLNEVTELNFSLEKEIQEATERNLKSIFNLDLVKSEFTLAGLRIDTLAFDDETKSFVIIEYKKGKNFSVIDQGVAYLALMLNKKADCILEFNENSNKNLKKDDVDWSQSRVIFISPSFTKYQQSAINFKDLPIELWEVKKFSNKMLLFNQLISPDTIESIRTISKSNIVEKVSKEIKVYTEEYHLNAFGTDKTRELYNELRNAVLNFGDDIVIKSTKPYIGFKKKTNFLSIEIQKSKIKIHLNLKIGNLADPKSLARDVSKVGHWGSGDYEIAISDSNNINYILDLIKQSYDKN